MYAIRSYYGKVPEAIDSTGFDAIVIQGKCADRSVLKIHPAGVEFHDAGDIWGMETYAAEDALMKRFGRAKDGYRRKGAVVIGPAGERLVRFAVIENDYWRSAGRTGVGTVMGAKQVKGIRITSYNVCYTKLLRKDARSTS